MLTFEEVAQMLRMSVPEVKNLVKRHRLPVVSLSPKKRRVPKEEFFQWAASKGLTVKHLVSTEN